MGRREVIHPGILLLRKKLPDVIIHLEICDGIRAGTLSYRILVHILDLGYAFKISRQSAECTRGRPHLVQVAVQRRMQDISDKGRLSAAAHASDNRQYPKRELHIYIVQIMFHRPFYGYGVLPRTLLPDISPALTFQILQRQRPLFLLG